MQQTDRVIQTLELGFRKVLEAVGIVVWEQFTEVWHQLNGGYFGPLLLQNDDCRIYKRPEIKCDYDVLASCLIDEMGNSRGGISGRNREDDGFRTDDSDLGGGVCDRV